MVIWLFGPASVTPGASRVIALIVRSVGSWLTISILKFVATSADSAAGGAAVTVTCSKTPAFNSASARVDVDTSTLTRVWTLCIPGNSKVAR